MQENTFTPSNWQDLQELLFHESFNVELDRVRSPFIYRGLSDFNYRLETSLERLRGPFVQLERHLLRNFIKYSYNAHPQGTSDWHWLALAQHHGLPTRLMDWTYSPLVALHFATVNIEKFNIDGVIWAMNYEKINAFLPEKPRDIIRNIGSHSFTSEMLLKAYNSLTELSEAKEDFVIIFESAALDPRIINQYALFSMMSSADAVLNDWLKGHPDMWFRINVPAAMKWEIRDKLDAVNINERVLFPGMDGLSKWLKRHYSPKE